MSGRDEAVRTGGVVAGELDAAGETVTLSFHGESGPVRLQLPSAELMALVSVCIGLAGEALPKSGDTEHPAIPVADWRVGVTATEALVLGLAPEGGGALAFRLTTRQAGEMAAALSRGLELAAPGEAALQSGRNHH